MYWRLPITITVAATEQAKAFQQTQKRPLLLISGIELSTRWHGFDIHIIGLNINENDPIFNQRLQQQHATRLTRCAKYCSKVSNMWHARYR